MRICFIAVGTFNHIGPYLDYFKQAGHEVCFVSLSPGPERSVPTYNLGLGGKYSETKGKWKYPVSMLRARGLIKRLRPDVVHAHYATSAGLAALVCGFHPTIVTAHGSDVTTGVKSALWWFLLKKIFRFADCVNVVSDELGEMVMNLGINKEKIETFTLGIDTEKFSFSGVRKIEKSRPLRMVCTRRLEPVFDHDTIIHALALLRQKGVEFEMKFAGEGSLRGSLERQVKDLGLDDCVKFLGKIANEELPELLEHSDVYLSASLWDGASLSLLEALASGLFPIVSDIKANSAWIKNDRTGLLHKLGDAEDLANCVMKLLDKPEMAEKAGAKNRENLIEKADRKKNMKLLESVYENLIRTAR
ncbi:MAG: glycosyltransferase [Sedimentisphaerales bacterium]|nr:glycosyltransferase [Sedimentisphaerales bacterium]